MELRNRKIVSNTNNLVSLITLPSPPPPTTNPTKCFTSYDKLSNHEINIDILLKKLCVSINIHHPNQSETENFITKIRGFRELYFMFDYYELKRNPKFAFSIEIAIIKAKELIIDLNNILRISGYFGRTRISPRNQKLYIVKKLIDDLEMFIEY